MTILQGIELPTPVIRCGNKSRLGNRYSNEVSRGYAYEKKKKKNSNIESTKKVFLLGKSEFLTSIRLAIHVHEVLKDAVFSCCLQCEPERQMMEKGH